MNRTDWARLEPDARADDMKDGLEARVRDPLWLLSRQWQFGERHGEDGGSPVRVDLDIAEDRITGVELTGGNGASEPVPYEGEPLEAVVERERVLTDDDPPLIQRVEAGQQFLRTLADSGYGEYTADQFPEQFRLDPPDQALESSDRQYVDFVSGRTLDGAAVARAIHETAGDALTGEADGWATSGPGQLPLPAGGSRTAVFDEAIETFYEWYLDLYEEPTTTDTAWDPARLAYRFSVTTGEGDAETVFEAPESRGGHLDWYAFESAGSDQAGSGQSGGSASGQGTGGPVSEIDLTETDIVDDRSDPFTLSDLADVFDGSTIHRSKSVVPSQVTFPGMPASRFWEFEDDQVDLSKIASDGADLSRLALTEFALLYGNEWFQIDVDTPVGTLTRITDLRVTDSFGVTERARPALDDDWQLFMHELSGGAGLFLPPTLGASETSDPVERVVFARDETANLAFGIERVVEGPTGRPLDRTEFQPPALVVDRLVTDDDPDEEFVQFANPGEDRLVLDGYTVGAETGDTTTRVAILDTLTLGPGETIRLYTGDGPETALSAGQSRPVWTAADALRVETPDGQLAVKRLLSRPTDALADYRLSTDIPEYWFPFTPQQGLAFTLERALFLDADTLDLPLEQLPRPRGELLRPDDSRSRDGDDPYRIYDEELLRGGLEVTRQYQYTRWTDGSGYLWGSRKTRPGGTQLSSGLRFDVLEEREES